MNVLHCGIVEERVSTHYIHIFIIIIFLYKLMIKDTFTESHFKAMRLRNRNLSQSPAETLTTPDARRPKTTGRKKRPKNELTQEEHKKEDVPRGASTTPRRTRKRGPKSTSLETNENPGLSSDRSDEITADAKSAENSQAGEDSSSILTPNRTPSINHAPSRTARQSSRRKRLVPDDNWAQEATSSPVLTRRRARERMQNKQSNFQEDTNNEAENSPNNDYGSSLNNAHQVESNEKSQKKVEKVIQPEQDLGSTLTDTAQIQPGSLVSGVGDTGDDPVSKQQSDLNSRKLPNDKPGIPSSSPCSLITAEPKKTTPSPTFRKAGTQNENNSPLKTTQAVSSSVSKNQLKTKKRKKKKRRNNLDNDEEEAPEQISFGDGMQSVLQRISAEQEAIQMYVTNSNAETEFDFFKLINNIF